MRWKESFRKHASGMGQGRRTKPVLRMLLLDLLLISVFCSCSHTEYTIPPSMDPAQCTEDSFAPDSGEHSISMLFLNIGKADCIVLCADERFYLIDTGTLESSADICQALEEMQVETLAGVFLTHSDKDHIGGWQVLADTFPVEKLYAPLYTEAPALFTSLAGDVPLEWLAPGTSIPVGGEGLFLDVLAPFRVDEKEENNNSLVLRLDAGENTVLFTGDMKEKECKDLLASGYDLHATVWKVPYHGRKEGNKKALLKVVEPSISIICADTQTHPDTADEDVIARLQKYGEVYTTQDAARGWYVVLGETVTVTDWQASQE